MPQIICRGFWGRWILLIWLFVVVYCIGLAVWTQKPLNQQIKEVPSWNFDWLDNVTTPGCRNSKQGPVFISDDKGYICPLGGLMSNGCCDTDLNSTLQYNCFSCQANRCCKVFENCVSCCLHPNKKTLLENVLVHAQNSRNPLLRSVKDKFELCLHKCRTSSSSVVRENKYRDQYYKYCFGVDVPNPHAAS